MADAKPVAFHRYLTDASGALLPLWRVTQEPCPECPPIRKEAFLGITFESPDGRSETVQCMSCDYSLTRPRRDPPGRRMNQGLQDPSS